VKCYAKRSTLAAHRNMSKADRYNVVVARMGGSRFRPWGWEIWRNGPPLPVRVRERGFETEHTARLAGRVALREFLSGLADEERKPDP
jgi:hypothetical protein